MKPQSTPPTPPPVPGGYCPTDDGLIWRHVTDTTMPNLWVASREGRDAGMVQRPPNSNGDRNYWRAYAGTGHTSRLIGHRSSREAAMLLVERSV
jgi:hypothetical protein